eukprot:2113339-Rhodomonas_salina.1
MLKTLNDMLPPARTWNEQFSISPLDKKAYYHVDVSCTLENTFKFILEVDGTQHFTLFENRALFDHSSFVAQQARDRFVEQWSTSQGYSIFRVPETLNAPAKRRTAMEY